MATTTDLRAHQPTIRVSHLSHPRFASLFFTVTTTAPNDIRSSQATFPAVIMKQERAPRLSVSAKERSASSDNLVFGAGNLLCGPRRVPLPSSASSNSSMMVIVCQSCSDERKLLEAPLRWLHRSKQPSGESLARHGDPQGSACSTFCSDDLSQQSLCKFGPV